ncbi:MAG: hypothetical protein ACRDBG_23890, partial [Waterburya sp.]
MEIEDFGEFMQAANGKRVKEVLFCEDGEIEHLGVQSKQVINVVLKAGTKLMRPEFAKDTCFFSENEEETDHGTMYVPLLRFVMA